jgi:hypothetical protein
MQISKKKPLRAFEVTIIKKPQSGFTNNSQEVKSHFKNTGEPAPT